MKRRTCRPRVEELELRTTPSATGVHSFPMIPAAPGQVSHPPATGMLSGNYTSPMAIPDVGKSYTLTGHGGVAGLGKVSVSGSLYALGFTPSGHAGGTLTLSNSQGTLTLALIGPTQPGFSPLPTRFINPINFNTGMETDRAMRAASKTAMSSAPVAAIRAVAWLRHTSARKSAFGATAPTTHTWSAPTRNAVADARYSVPLRLKSNR